ncbi:MAG: phosphate-starvation-inducible PsiE family protein [Vulcanococcus sp.]
MGQLNDRGFLAAITGFERVLAKVLSIALSLVLVVASVQMLLFLGNDLLDLQVNWTGEGLIRLLDEILVILIALEVLQNLTAYLREHVVQIELVLVTALTAVARKVIVMPPGMQKSPGELIGLGVAVLALAAAYWLVRQSNVRARPTRTEPAIGSPEPDRLPPAGGAGGG